MTVYAGIPNIPEMRVIFPSTFSFVVCVVRGSWIDFDGGSLPSLKMQPWETSAQALQREYPGCEIYVGNLRVNSPGNRKWLA